LYLCVYFGHIGKIAKLLSNPELYGEFDTGETFQSALDVVNRAKEQFNTLPAELRKRFSYDPYEFLSYVNNPDNAEEMKKFGLLKEDIPVANIPETGSQPVIQPAGPAVTQPSSTVEPTP
jgi:phage internal scaffolding protein